MSDERPDYVSYLLRLWRTSDAEPKWRASLESTRTGEIYGFRDLSALMNFLLEQTANNQGPQ